MGNQRHRWKFFRAGGLDQAMIRDGGDVVSLDELDQKLWVALACPVKGLELDEKTLALLDSDKDGRIRAPEVLQAVKWVREVRKDPGELLKGGDAVALSAINDQGATGAALLAGARRILASLGKADATSISLADVAGTEQIFSATAFNGDGVIPPESAPAGPLRQAIEDIISTHGSTPDRGGKAGVSQTIVDAFFSEAEALSGWARKGEEDRALLPLGAGTEAAAAAVAAVRVKVDDYFTRCRLAGLDPRAAAALSGSDEEFKALAAKDLSAGSAEVARLPIARIEPGRPLPLEGGVNPAWAAALAELGRAALAPLLGTPRTSLTEADWLAVQGRLAAYHAWTGGKPATAAEKLGVPRLREILALKEGVLDLLRQDAALEGDFAQLGEVERLVRYQRDLVKLLNNFVNFSEFYARQGAAFQAGTLFLDARSCDLCVHVADAAKHAALAGLAKSYLVYCDCTRKGAADEKMTIAAAFTDGDADQLMVGRNGVFYDRKGRDWDATITKIVENPISIRQAFWAPYKNFIRLVEDQISKRAAAAEAESAKHVEVAAAATASSDKTPPAGGVPEPKKIDIGTVAALGVAVAGIATFFSSLLATFFGLGAWMPLGFLALVLAISGPSMLIAWLKLHQRNLGPILDANGWAINGRVRITVPFGGALTNLPSLPPGSERSLRDPYAEKRSPWRTYLALIILAVLAFSWYLGKLDQYLPRAVRSLEVLGERAPAYENPSRAPQAPDKASEHK